MPCQIMRHLTAAGGMADVNPVMGKSAATIVPRRRKGETTGNTNFDLNR